MQLTLCAGREARQTRSWPLGAVRMTERFLPDKRATKKQIKALARHVRAKVERDAPWLSQAGRGGGRLAGIGGTVRNLGAAAQIATGLPSHGVQGFELGREALDALVDELAERSASERRKFPGVKPERGDLILAGALVVQTIMDMGAFGLLEVTEAGLREGVFLSTLLAPLDPPIFADVREAAVCNLAGQYDTNMPHVKHVAALALEMFDALAAGGAHPGDPEERDLLWAAAILHDIGVAIDYDDHHKHSRYLILNAGLPGYSQRETALIGQIARYHRKGTPTLGGEFGAVARPGDEARVCRCSAILRLAEQLERARDRSVRGAHMEVTNGAVTLRLDAGGDAALARWAAERQVDLFERAFKKTLEVSAS
jgi:exopolyphosphatase/guanosine-5'-triphosphate,3'-diphosphate pyrophosphatase